MPSQVVALLAVGGWQAVQHVGSTGPSLIQ